MLISRPFSALIGLLSLLGSSGVSPVWAAEPAETSDPTAPTPAAAPAPVTRREGPVAVTVELEGYAAAEQQIQLAVAKELGVAVTPTLEHAGSVVRVSAKKGGDLSVVYQPKDGSPLLRAVRAPERDDEVAEVVALLVGNLARDQASELLDALEPKPAAPEVSAPPPDVEPTPEAEAAPPAEPKSRPFAPVNLSLFHPLATIPRSETARVQVEFGLLYSRVGEVGAFALNPLVLRIDGPASGASIAGIASFIDGGGTGMRVSGVYGQDEGDVRGLGVTGAVQYSQGDFTGVSVTGAVNYRQGSSDGLSVTGAVNVSTQRSSGAAFAGAANIVRGPFDGMMVADAVNVAHALKGAQFAVGLNHAEDVIGAQFAAVNVGGDVTGAQFGIVNVGGRVHGLQLGVVNVAEDVDGASIGMITYSRQGRVQPVAWYSTTTPANVGVRFYTGPLYAMPTLGFELARDIRSTSDSEVATFSPGFSIGGRVPVERAFVDVEVNYSQSMPKWRFDEHDLNLRYRVLAGFYVTSWFAPFVGGGVLHHFRTQGPRDESFTPELSLGVQFL